MWTPCCRWWSRSWRTWASPSTSPESSTRCWSSPTVSDFHAFLLWLNFERFSSRAADVMMLIWSTGYVTTIIEDAKIYATHAKKSTVDSDDIKLAIQCRMDQSFTSPPPRDVMNVHCDRNIPCWNERMEDPDRFPLCAVPVGGGEAEEPDSAAPHQTVHRTQTTSRPVLSDGAQLQTQVRTEEGKDVGCYWGNSFSLVGSSCEDFLPLSLTGVIDCWQDNGPSPQRWRRVQQAEHAHPRWGWNENSGFTSRAKWFMFICMTGIDWGFFNIVF